MPKYMAALRSAGRALVPLALVVAFAVTAGVAQAHDDAWWIEIEKSYRMTSGTSHCCSKNHCHRVKPGEVERIAGGWLVVETGQVFQDNQPYGLYESIDLDMWQCSWPNNWVCLFFPKTGF
jgi:hypothetical protein